MIFILTGPIHSGKTTFLKKAVYKLTEKKFKTDGFLSEAIWKNKKTVGYDLFDLKKKRAIPFIRRKGKKEWPRIGSFFFIPQSLTEAKKIILRGKNSDVVVVDEVGPLELVEDGLWPALKQVIFQPQTRYLLVVRMNILEDVLGMVGKSEVKIFEIKNKGLNDVKSLLLTQLTGDQKGLNKVSKVKI